MTSNNIQYSWKRPDLIDHDKFLHIIEDIAQLNVEDYKKDQRLSLTVFLYLFTGILLASGVHDMGLCVTVQTELSLGAGTGSSASFAVSLAGALLRYLSVKTSGHKTSDDPKVFTRSELGLVSEWAFRAEKIIHGNPSGVDNTVCTFGSVVSFRKGNEPVSLHTSQEIRGILVDTRVPKNTGEMVKKVEVLKERHPKVVESILESIEELCGEAVEYFSCLGLLDKAGSTEDIDHCYRNLNVSRYYLLVIHQINSESIKRH